MNLLDVLVIGGGYAGVLAALRAKAQLGDEGRVALVSPEECLIERVRLHEAIAWGRDVRIPLIRLVGPGVELIRDHAVAIEPGRAVLGSGRELHARAIVLATGLPMRSAIAGAERVENDGMAVHRLVAALSKDGRIIVIGGGLTGVELAGELAEAGRPTTLLSATEHLGGSDLNPRGSAALWRALTEVGVQIEVGRATVVDGGAVHLEGGRAIPAALAIGTVGMAEPTLAVGPIDSTLSAGPGLFVAGDGAAHAVGVRTGCKTAMPLGAHAAENAVRSLRGEALRPFAWRFLGSCVSVGRRRGVVQHPSGLLVTGRLGAWIKEAITRYTIASMHLEQRELFRYRWPEQPLLGAS